MRCHDQRPKSSKQIISTNPTSERRRKTSLLKDRLLRNHTPVKMHMSNQESVSFARICCAACSCAIACCLGSGAILQRSISELNTSKQALVPSQTMSEAQTPQRANVRNGGSVTVSQPVSMMLSTMQMRPTVPAHHHLHMGGVLTANMMSNNDKWSQKSHNAQAILCCGRANGRNLVQDSSGASFKWFI